MKCGCGVAAVISATDKTGQDTSTKSTVVSCPRSKERSDPVEIPQIQNTTEANTSATDKTGQDSSTESTVVSCSTSKESSDPVEIPQIQCTTKQKKKIEKCGKPIRRKLENKTNPTNKTDQDRSTKSTIATCSRSEERSDLVEIPQIQNTTEANTSATDKTGQDSSTESTVVSCSRSEDSDTMEIPPIPNATKGKKKFENSIQETRPDLKNLTKSLNSTAKCYKAKNAVSRIRNYTSSDDTLYELSESDFVPSSPSSSDDEMLSSEIEPPKKKKKSLAKKHQPVTSSVRDPPTKQKKSHAERDQPLASSDEEPSTSISESDIKVIQTNNDGVIRKYDKKQFCLYCGSKQARLSRHWFTKHAEEREVIQIQSLKSDKAARLNCMAKLRNLGNHAHNCEVLRQGKGEFLVTYRPRGLMSASAYLPCEHCFCYLSKRELWRHRCKLKSKDIQKGGRVAARSLLLLPTPKGISKQVNEILNGMVDGPVKMVARGDDMIVKFASKLFLRHGLEQKEYVRAKIRELSRLLLIVRTNESLGECSIQDCIHPAMFGNVVSAVRNVAGFDDSTQSYQTPSLALKLGHSLRKCAKILKGKAIEQQNNELLKNADDFFELCTLEWSDEVSSNALKTLHGRKRNKAKLLPLASDTLKLNEHLSSESKKAKEELRTNADSNVSVLYRKLSELTLARIIVFNRRRQGEVSKMKQVDFTSRPQGAMSNDVLHSLSRLEQELCRIFERVEIIGKRGRTVPVLLDKEIQDSLSLLLPLRMRAGVPEDNTYLFPCSNYGSMGHIRGSDCVRKFALACGADHPSTLTSTNFRKHIATMSQMLSLKPNELDLLAQYLGHDISVHREFYRLPQDTLQLAKISKLFLMMDSGNITGSSNIYGKSLDEAAASINTGNSFPYWLQKACPWYSSIFPSSYPAQLQFTPLF